MASIMAAIPSRQTSYCRENLRRSLGSRMAMACQESPRYMDRLDSNPAPTDYENNSSRALNADEG